MHLLGGDVSEPRYVGVPGLPPVLHIVEDAALVVRVVAFGFRVLTGTSCRAAVIMCGSRPSGGSCCFRRQRNSSRFRGRGGSCCPPRFRHRNRGWWSAPPDHGGGNSLQRRTGSRSRKTRAGGGGPIRPRYSAEKASGSPEQSARWSTFPPEPRIPRGFSMLGGWFWCPRIMGARATGRGARGGRVGVSLSSWRRFIDGSCCSPAGSPRQPADSHHIQSIMIPYFKNFLLSLWENGYFV